MNSRFPSPLEFKFQLFPVRNNPIYHLYDERKRVSILLRSSTFLCGCPRIYNQLTQTAEGVGFCRQRQSLLGALFRFTDGPVDAHLVGEALRYLDLTVIGNNLSVIADVPNDNLG